MSINNKYYTVGITGHRDLLQSKISQYKEHIRNYLLELSKSVDKSLLLISPLADGADRLFIEAGQELDLKYEVILPMPQKYSAIDIVNGKNIDDIKEYGPDRDEQYFAIGKYLAQKCDALVALWDGAYNQKVGGTADVIKYRKNIGKDFFHIVCKRKGHI